MKVIPKLQQGNTIESDNTKVVRPEIHEPIKAKPRQYSIVDLGGEPSNDTRSAAERNRDYWHPIKGAKARFRASMSNETNPLVGIERTILPSAAVVGGALGNMTVDKLTGGWGNWLEDKTGIPSEIGVYTNPGAWYGGAKGYKIGKNKLITKSIKGDADLAWNPINKNHWIFNKEARTPSNIAMATANRITPFLSKVEKLPLKVAAYKAAKRTNGNASVSLQDIKTMPADYAKRWNDSPNTANQVRLTKQAALMDKVGRPFILQQSNPIWIEGSSVRNPELVTMAHGGRFDFKKSPLLKKQEEINGKRDMRKKFIKSSRPTYKKRIKKAQQGMRFVSYNPVSNPTIDYTDITNPINPFSEYNYNTTYDKPEALVVPVRDTDETDVVANNPTVEPVINKPVASKPVTNKPVTKTANSTWKSPYTNRKQWSTELINAYKKAGITNDNAIRMLLAQDALESSWGKSAQGKYNFGNLTTGSSWKGDYVTGNDKNAKGEAIKQKFRSYNSMDEYAANKIQFLKRLYDFDENDDINKFVAKLTGSNKGKRRYAEATNYAKVLTGVYNGIPKGENGMIIKYQNPPHGIARRDAIKDYRPEIPLSPIKQPVKPYMPTQQPILSPDNRTGWEKEVSRQIKADRAKNDNLYGNQHTWNWSAPFTNARITKDNASAMFDFDKSAAMSTFAIGQGIASPVTTATSIAGSLVGAGIGNKVAGEKGALVGGFVGGMVNPKFGMRFNKKNNSSNIKQPMVMAKESKLTPEEIAGIPKGERNQPIKSKLDWKNWSKGGPISKEHLAEYAQIERDARRRGYWLMTSDGKAWEGDPRTWVQLMSKDGSRFKKGKFPSNDDLYYSGVSGDDIIYDDYNGRLWASTNPTTARSYTNSDDRVMTIGVPNDSKTFEMDAQGEYWQKLMNPYTGKKSTTDEIVNDIFDKGNDIALIKNVKDNGPHLFKGSKYGDYFSGNEGNDVIINRKVPRKSLVGNNGDFNINNPNLYKALAPFLLIGGMSYDKWIY